MSTFKLPQLPYSKDALEPHISAETLSYHYDKHHNTYVSNLNNLINNTEYTKSTLEEVILKSPSEGIFNNAAQVWNHTFYWHSMKSNGGGSPYGDIKIRIEKDFGSYENFKNEFLDKGLSQFGSGWVWLTWNGQKLTILKTGNADLPMRHNQKAIIVADVWEHAYYIDYRNQRVKYLEVFLDKLLNWDFANENLSKL